jgi:ATP-dependent Zn protease
MATDNPAPESQSVTAQLTASHTQLSYELRRLTRVATFVAIVSSPSVYYYFHHYQGWAVGKSLVFTFIACAACRGLCDILVRKVIPWPSLFGTDDRKLREDDVMNRRRAWTWRWFFRLTIFICAIITIIYMIQIHQHPTGVTWLGIVPAGWAKIVAITQNPLFGIYALQLPILFLTNFLIFLGPLVLMGVMQMKVFQPGDADWGVKLDDVRGQDEAKEEIRRIITLWQSGEVFEMAGGKRERGLIFHGAPGTGKTMMAKAIATGFNSPFITMPGSGFAQTFIGIDAVIVRILAWRAKRQAKKWGGQCIVFIDEIDAVGMRRASLGGSRMRPSHLPAPNGWEPEYHGRYGSLSPSGDLVCEDEQWREWKFRHNAPEPRAPYPPWFRKLADGVNQGIFPGFGGGGSLALNQLLVVMDGLDNPPFWRKFWNNRANSFLDAVYVVPRRVKKRWAYLIAAGLEAIGVFLILNTLLDETAESPFYAPLTAATAAWNIIIIFIGGVIVLMGVGIWGAASGRRKRKAEAKEWFKKAKKDDDDDGTVSLRLPKAKTNQNQIYFVGATNVPLEMLDPALTRPGRMGRHVWFRTPTKHDRRDIFDLYLGKVAHDPELDSPERRDEIARITNGYSPADIEQVCSMALATAHHSGRAYFMWPDLVDAMTVVESGSAINVTYLEEEAMGTALHEAGHAATAHVYRPEVESARISIRMRGDGSLGHHYALEKDERFTIWQSGYMGRLIWFLGGMAAEFVFRGENTSGVGGDLYAVSGYASQMVGASGMSPLPLDLNGKTFPDMDEDKTRERVLQRLEDIGVRLLNTGSIPDMRKRSYAAQFVGQAFVTAYNLIRINRDKIQAVADEVVEKKEIYGNELMHLLDSQEFVKPEIDWTDEEYWPKIMDYSKRREPQPQATNAETEERTM